MKGKQCAVFCQTLRRPLRAILTSGVLLIRDNARPHSAVATQQLLQRFKWNMYDHPAAYKHSLLQLSPIATYDESDWTTECESL
ncbi:hypothetical protein AVEN_247470-1 [Araneus ventricosus]|uniref:Mariner Mos1 transposase n=1 Tax=Araneus ventricosus TaxID=182803 RepID=A0A4Y2J9Q9_ARAVE|nr:hypothetical protein AVEN_247470-1 [Araneus ventricosus]